MCAGMFSASLYVGQVASINHLFFVLTVLAPGYWRIGVFLQGGLIAVGGDVYVVHRVS
jgi:hypothetical protein